MVTYNQLNIIITTAAAAAIIIITELRKFSKNMTHNICPLPSAQPSGSPKLTAAM